MTKHTDSREIEEEQWRPATRMVRGGTRRSAHGETSEAMYLTSGYVYEDAAEAEARFKGEAPGFVYSRFGNPTVAMFERRLALIEGAEACKATSTGMAAVFAALMAQLRAGDHVVAARALFGSCLYIVSELLPRYGIEVTLVDGVELDQWRAAFRPDTRCAFLESPSNPGLEIIDLEAVSALAHGVGARLVVDNVFATPLLQPAMRLGADIVVYSATKHIDGQGRCLGGAILSSQAFVDEELLPFLRHTGPSLSPFNAWVLLKGLETLDLRVERMCANALAVATLLEGLGGVERVLYPGLASHPQHALAERQMSAGGTIVSFDIAGGKAAAFDFLDRLGMIEISNNLGDAKSLITHPATTTHQRLRPEQRAALGIGDGLVRLSVGLEDVEDIKSDLGQAMAGG
ncbi:MAG: O-succinylhomoserine sulfhydrylase [Alphaproteobacteria bacterium]|jgi:O-succinylhomoserine sulfhydrylase|nr:O-succinylhomoserine sulfhydrylase [Alphaproteobacteria bacterium]MDP6588263.1 O-succinylhomoserine sulfhydrylase [Alphaproteobacteria bacterium]MDP6818860.1 O-succinylhomoserine sulfhydrylase [Alphaproteobacteria bacterium]|tara:strand:+ start:166 stop:1374 length:1209 start_codon:yes stop_codon:yes gene_type:complete